MHALGTALLSGADRLGLEDEGERAVCAACTCYGCAFASDLVSMLVMRRYEPERTRCDIPTWWPRYSCCWPCIVVARECCGGPRYPPPPPRYVNVADEY